MSFIVFALPRSRTAWLSRALSYGPWHCGHDELVRMRGYDDVVSWFKQECVGTVETAAGSFWRTVQKVAPTTRVVVLRRDLDQVYASLARTGIVKVDDKLKTYLRRNDDKLQQISTRWEGALSISFDELGTETGFAKVFEHCLPFGHNHDWWTLLDPINVQVNFKAQAQYVLANWPQLTKFREQIKNRTLRDLRKTKPVILGDDVQIKEEDFDRFLLNGEELFHEHSTQIDLHPEHFKTLNIPLYRTLYQAGFLQVVVAYSNGKMFGYLLTILGPSIEHSGKMSATHNTYYASPFWNGLGRKLHIKAVEFLRQKNVDELYARAGVAGDGPRMGIVHQRLGAEFHGEMWRLKLQD